jgi:hypothetical protein
VTDGFGQQFTGNIRGAVRDADGIIPGVTVALVNEATSVSRETVTNASGEYNFPAIPPATYTIRASISGYKGYERRGVRIATQQFVTIDLLMEVGTVAESITVTGEAPLIETSTASQGTVLSRDMLESMPSPGRNAFLVATLVPTVNWQADPRWNRQQDQICASQISLGGGGVRANNYVLDGVPISEMQGRPVVHPTMEAIDDIKVQVHTFDAEMGRTGGGVFNTTARSGTNIFHGSGFYQTRPVWGSALPYFAEKRGDTKESTGLDSSYYRLWGGAIGGPIVKNRTFFWTSTEGYRTRQLSERSSTLPSARQRVGDFSTTTRGGVPVRIFNPYCRAGVVSAKCPATGTGSLATGGEFTGAIIPTTHPAANPVAFKMASYWPLPAQGNENSLSNDNITQSIQDVGDMWTFKGEHKFTDNWSLSGLFLYNRTIEEGRGNFAEGLSYLDGSNYLVRHPKVFVLNNTNVLNNTTVLSLRYGFTSFPDGRYCVGGAPGEGCFEDGLASLGFNQTFINSVDATAAKLFPLLSFQNFTNVGQGLNTAPIDWGGPYAVNAALTKLVGRHSLKFGADLRELFVKTTLLSETAGRYSFQDLFTAGPGRVGGYDFASFLVGAPSTGSISHDRGDGKYYTRYWGAYAHDDWRANARFTLNYGLRIEHEDGLREENNRITVGFDPTATNSELQAIEAAARRNGYAGPAFRGGLLYAGENGANTYQGDPPAIKLSPRFGATWALNDNTVLRGGYGLFWAPWQYIQTGHGTIGFTRTNEMAQSAVESEVPLISLDNPFPGGLVPPTASRLGILTGLGGDIEFVDQNKGGPKVHQYAIDVQRQLPAQMAVSLAYMGSTGVDIGYGGSTQVPIELNQIDPSTLPRDANGRWDAAALRRSVPNPFFGVAGMGELASRPTILAGQLLRPYPQFGNVSMVQTTDGGRQNYNAVIARLVKRMGDVWGGQFSYTWSRLRDNQWGELSTFVNRTATPQNYYDLDAEYGVSVIDTPHRVTLSPIVRIPGPSTGVSGVLLGDWNLSAMVEFVSGPPIAAYNASASETNLGLFGGLQRLNPTDQAIDTPGSQADRIATADHPAAAWIDRGAFANPGVGAYGTLPRLDTRTRHPFRRNVDLVATKGFGLTGTQRAEIRFEFLNLTNNPMFAGTATNFGAQNFGQITTTRGYSRITQVTMRYTF